MKRKKWNIIHIPKYKEVRIVDENGSTILKNHSLSFPPDPCVPHLTEDWHLIAAAPEMLDALEMVIAFEDWERYSHPDHKDSLRYDEVIDRVRSVITKAKGENQ